MMIVIKNVLVLAAAIWMARLALWNILDMFRQRPNETRFVSMILQIWISAFILLMAYCVMGAVNSRGDAYNTDAWRLSGYGWACVIVTAIATIPRLAVWFARLVKDD